MHKGTGRIFGNKNQGRHSTVYGSVVICATPLWSSGHRAARNRTGSHNHSRAGGFRTSSASQPSDRVSTTNKPEHTVVAFWHPVVTSRLGFGVGAHARPCRA